MRCAHASVEMLTHHVSHNLSRLNSHQGILQCPLGGARALALGPVP
jgi:hypothetical protein